MRPSRQFKSLAQLRYNSVQHIVAYALNDSLPPCLRLKFHLIKSYAAFDQLVYFIASLKLGPPGVSPLSPHHHLFIRVWRILVLKIRSVSVEASTHCLVEVLIRRSVFSELAAKQVDCRVDYFTQQVFCVLANVLLFVPVFVEDFQDQIGKVLMIDQVKKTQVRFIFLTTSL